MRLHLAVLLLAVWSTFAGCASLQPIDLSIAEIDDGADLFFGPGCEMEGKEAVKGLARLARTRPGIKVSDDGHVDLSPFPSTCSPIATRILLAQAPRGSFVHLDDSKTFRKWIGTVQSVDSEHVVLNDCLFADPIAGPQGERAVAMSFVRTLAVDVAPLTHMRVFSVPSRKDEAEFLCDRGRDDVVTGFAFVSGRRQSMSAASAPGSAPTQPLSQVAPGSRIGWRDLTNAWWEATLVEIENDEASLADCMRRSTTTGPKGERQEKTSLLRPESAKCSGLQDVIVLALPGPDSKPKPEEDDSCDRCLEGIVFESGRRMNIRFPTPDDINQRHDARPASSLIEAARK